MFQGACVTCIMNAALSFSRRLGSGQRMFSVDARFEQAGVVLSPSRFDFSHELARLWDDALQAISTMPVLTSSKKFKNLIDDNVKGSAFQTVEEVLNGCGLYRNEIGHIEDLIVDQMGAAEANANEQYMRYYRIYEFGEGWNERTYSSKAHTLESLSSQIRYMSDLKGDLAGFRMHRTSGAFMVHGAGLRSKLEPIPEQGLAVMMRLAGELAHDKSIT